MKRERSWTRQQYEMIYSMMRKGRYEEVYYDPIVDREILKAADYSYQARGCEQFGWSSHRRYRAFLDIKWRILSRGDYLPF